MDEAFVENAEHQVDDQDGHYQQHPESAERRLERLRGSLEAGRDAIRQDRAREFFDFAESFAERNAGSDVERNCCRGKLPRMIDLQWPERSCELDQGIEWHQLPARRTHV